MDYEKIKETAQNYQDDMTRFLRAIVKNPGESCDERKHIETIEAEMKKLNFDEVTIDPQGNVIGYMGNGDKILAFDAHIDTVGIGNIENWNFDPYEGYETDEEIGGRGVSDQCGGLVSAVYGAKIMKDMDLIPEGYKIMVVGTGSISLMKIRSVRNSLFPQNRQMAVSTEDSVAVWRSVLMSKVFPAMVPHRSVVTMPSTKWPTSFRTYVPSTKTMMPMRQKSRDS